MEISRFNGVRTKVSPAKIRPDEFPIDQGSDRFENDRWARRRGMRHTNLNKYSSAVSAILGFDLPGEDYATLIVEGNNVYGINSLGEREDATASSSNTLSSAYSSSHRASVAEYRRQGYISNGWDKVKVWDGRSAAWADAGISGPSQEEDSWTPVPVEASGSGTVGPHFFQYRYLNSETGYVSNPSEEREVEITTSNGKLTFLIGAIGSTIGPDAVGTGFAFAATTITRNDAGDWTTDGIAVGDYITIANAEDSANDGTYGPVTTVTSTIVTISSGSFTVNADDTTVTFVRATKGRIQPSTDGKVDKIVIEMTTVGSTSYFYATEELNPSASGDGTIEVDLSDATLRENLLEWPDTGHQVPPVGKNLVSHGERLWLFGQVVHSTGNCTVASSVNVAAGSSAPDWRASALGDSTAATPTYPSVAWHFQVDGDTASYEIDTYDESDDELDLKIAYAGTPASDVSYKIFSRSNEIWVSEPGYPEAFSPLTSINGPNGEGAGDLTAGIGFRNSMIFFTPNGTFAYSWDQGPLIDGIQTPLSNKSGALNQGVVIEVENTIYSMDRRGWYAWKGVTPRLISQPVDAVRSSIDYAQAEEFHAVYLPEARAVRWFVVYTGDTKPKNYVQYDIDSGSWSTGTYYQEITASRLVPSAEGLRPLLGDSAGHVWVGDKGTADGVTTDDSHRLCTSGSTTTTIELSTSTLPTADQGVTGCYAYHVEGQEARLITANTASQLTVSAFSNAPADGDAIWIGPIHSKLRTKAFRARRLSGKRRTTLFHTEYKVLTQGKLQVRVYEDFSGTAKAWATSTGRNSEQVPGAAWPGENTSYPSTDWVLDLTHEDGVIGIPIGSEWKRYFQVELEIFEPDVDLQILFLTADGDEIADEET